MGAGHGMFPLFEITFDVNTACEIFAASASSRWGAPPIIPASARAQEAASCTSFRLCSNDRIRRLIPLAKLDSCLLQDDIHLSLFVSSLHPSPIFLPCTVLHDPLHPVPDLVRGRKAAFYE